MCFWRFAAGGLTCHASEKHLAARLKEEGWGLMSPHVCTCLRFAIARKMYHWLNSFILAAALIHRKLQSVKDRIGACGGNIRRTTSLQQYEAENTVLLISTYDC